MDLTSLKSLKMIEKLILLAESIQENGLLDPLVVEKKGDHYDIIAGARKWEAKMAGLSEVPVYI